jgi:cytochrome oxidase Cu insertion factor (SCO1/SenC/PrrC family)
MPYIKGILFGFLLMANMLFCHANEKWLNYKFISHKNETILPKSMLGKYVIVNFTYTDCVMYCTTQTQQLKSLKNRLANEVSTKNILFLSISLRPDRDTTKSLNGFAKRFALENLKDWQFVTAKPAAIEELKNTLGVKVAYGKDENQVNHTTKIYLFDTHGEMVDAFEGIPLDDESIIKKINALEKSVT